MNTALLVLKSIAKDTVKSFAGFPKFLSGCAFTVGLYAATGAVLYSLGWVTHWLFPTFLPPPQAENVGNFGHCITLGALVFVVSIILIGIYASFKSFKSYIVGKWQDAKNKVLAEQIDVDKL